MEKKVLLIGTYSSLNKGDFAMHQALIKEIWNRIDDVEFCIFTMFPKIDEERYIDYFGSSCSLSFKDNFLVRPLHNTMLNIFSYFNMFDKFSEFEYIIDVSGDAIGEVYGLKNTIYRLLYLNLFKNLKKSMILAPQSFGPFKYTSDLFRNVLSDIKEIYIRDSMSKNYLEDIGIKNYKKSSDLSFLLGSKKSIINEYYLHDIAGFKGLKIGINLSYLIERFFKLKENVDIIKLALRLCEEIISRYEDVKIYFIPHVFGPEKTKDDRMIGKTINEKISKKFQNKFMTINEEMNFEEIKEIISNLDIFIGARLHACIGSASVGTPIINIGYSDKSKGLICEDFGLENCHIDIRKISDEQEFIKNVLAHMNNVLNSKKSIERTLESKSSEFRKLAEDSVEGICNTLSA